MEALRSLCGPLGHLLVPLAQVYLPLYAPRFALRLILATLVLARRFRDRLVTVLPIRHVLRPIGS